MKEVFPEAFKLQDLLLKDAQLSRRAAAPEPRLIIEMPLLCNFTQAQVQPLAKRL